MDLIVSIKNDTTYTPELKNVQLAGCSWVPTQELSDDQSIAGGRQIVGMVTGTIPFRGSLTVHYTWVKPGPTGADVVLEFEVTQLGPQHGVGFNERVLPPNVLVNTTSEAGKLDNVDVVLLRVQE